METSSRQWKPAVRSGENVVSWGQRGITCVELTLGPMSMEEFSQSKETGRGCEDGTTDSTRENSLWKKVDD